MADHFEPWSWLHGVVVVVFVLLTCGACWAGRLAARRGRERVVSRVLGYGGLVVVAGHQVYWLLPENFVWGRSLPLHLCDVAGVVAVAAMLTEWRVARGMLYFWGLCLSSQGFITPVLTEGPGRVIFWFFFVSHAMIVGSAVYDMVVRGFVPTWRDWRVVSLISLGYAAAMLALNIASGWNYGYVGEGSAAQATAVDLLGPWPWRVVLMAVIGIGGFALAMVPWEIARVCRGGEEREHGA